MKNPFKKISKKTVLIASTLVVLIAIPVSIYFLTRDQGDVKSWYSSSWMYRRAITVNNPGGTLTNEDVLITLDTASLISAGKLQADCDDLRFVDSNDSTSLQYWIEDDCNTSSTKIWTRIPSLTSGGKTIYVYYGNGSAIKGSLNWGGNVYMYADTTCPSGWTAASALNGKFLYGSATFGTTGGASSHSHTNVSCTSTSISTTNIAGSTSSGITSTSTTHTHTGLASTVNSQSVLPSYRNMVLCYRNRFTLNTGLISLFSGSTPSGWTRFTALDNYLPQANSSYGTTGGSNTHTHPYTGQTTAGPNASANSISTPLNATGGTITYSGSDKIHRFTSNGTFTPNKAGTIQVLVVGGGGGGGPDAYGGGGGGGAVVYNASYSVTAGAKSVTVGAGGASYSNGGNSVFVGITAVGGGGGGAGTGDCRNAAEIAGSIGKNGGSGGGAGGCHRDPIALLISGGTGSPGYNGGSIPANASTRAGAGGGGAGSVGVSVTTGQEGIGKNGGNGVANSITGSSVYYGGGGGGSGRASGGTGTHGGGNGSQTYNPFIASTAGAANSGGGGGGGSLVSGNPNSAPGGSGVVIMRYTNPPALSGTGASGTHTHSTSTVSINSPSNVPPYMTMIFGKANSSVYVNENNILPSSELPPLGWNRYSALDSKFVMGSATSGTTGGTSTHSHSATLTTGGPSATVNIYGSGANFASSVHTHSCSVNTNSASNLPPYYTVLYIKRKISVSTTVLQEEMYNLAPTAPTALLTEGATNPTGVTDLTPEFSAIYNDPDSGNTSSYYEIEVNTTSAFNGTVMWDSGKTAMTNVANGARIADKSYAGTTLSTNGATYYWRIRLWDQDDAVSPWSATAQFTMNNTPTAPTALLTEGATNPSGVTDLTPEFSAIYNDPDTGDTATYYEIEVNTTSAFNGTVMWDSNKTAMSAVAQGARIADKSYAGTTLSTNGTTYYWRIRLWDNSDTVSPWSATAQFTMNSTPTAPTALLTEGATNPTKVTDLTPEFSAIYNDPDTGDTAIYYEIEVNTTPAFNGTVMWDSNKTAMSAVANGARIADLSYAGTTLSLNGATYYWRIRLWDNSDTVSPWSATAQFTMSSPPNAPVELTVDGYLTPTYQIFSLYPSFRAKHTDINTDSAVFYEIEVNSNSVFTGTVMWDTGKQSMTSTPNNSVCPNITYAGNMLSNSLNTYYWRIRFWDTDDMVSPWSATASFVDRLTNIQLEGIGLEGLGIN